MGGDATGSNNKKKKGLAIEKSSWVKKDKMIIVNWKIKKIRLNLSFNGVN